MTAQLTSIGLALLIFPLFIWVPGMVLAYSTNLLEFRARPVPTQIAVGLLISISCLPIVSYLMARAGGFRAVWVFYGIVWSAAAILLLRHGKRLARAGRDLFANRRGTVVFIAICMIAGALFEMDWVSSNGVRPNLCNMDATAHVATTDALTRTGVPPVNPFVYPGYPVHLMYYYAWYIMCSLVDQLGGTAVTARSAVQAGKIYIGLGVVALIVAFLEIAGSRLLPGVKRIRTGVAVALLTITGLDLIPWVFLRVVHRLTGKGPGLMLSLEWWNEQVTAWLGAILMSPHHPASLIMCLTGLLMLLGIWIQPSRKWVLMGLASLAFASASATSVYVTLAFAAGLFLWLVFAAIHGWWDDVFRICLVGVVAGVLYIPMAMELAAASRTTGFPIAFTIRAFEPVDYWLPSIIHSLKGSRLIYLLRLLFLPLNYFLELGFFAVAAVLYWRWRRSRGGPLSKEESLLACVGLGSVLVCTFLHSTIRWNDLGWRGFLVAQFVLLLWAAPVAQAYLERKGPNASAPTSILRWPLLVGFCLLIGLAGTVVEIFNMRTNFWGPQGPQTIATRDAYVWIDQHTPRDTVVLFNPDEDIEYFNALYGHRQAAADGRIYAFNFGGVAKNKTGVLDDALGLFAKDESVDDVRKISDRYHVGAIVVLSSDPVWQDSASWVWKLHPAFTTDSSRVFVTAQALDSRSSNER
jgi:hypothetical protein